MTKMFCNSCAKACDKEFDLQPQLKRNIKNAVCERCRKTPDEGCMIYEVQRRKTEA